MYAKINQKTSNFLQTKRATYKKVDYIFSYNFCYILRRWWRLGRLRRVGVFKMSSTRDGTMAKGESWTLLNRKRLLSLDARSCVRCGRLQIDGGVVRWCVWLVSFAGVLQWNWGCCDLS